MSDKVPAQNVFPHPLTPETHVLTYLATDPPSAGLAIGTTTALPPTPRSFTSNPAFLAILNSVLARHAAADEGLISQAKALASPGGATTFGIGGSSSSSSSAAGRSKHRSSTDAPLSDSEGASGQGGAGGAGVGGWVHLSDARNPPDFGRIAWPEDILGSVEVDRNGNIVGDFQPSGTYRVITNEGM